MSRTTSKFERRIMIGPEEARKIHLHIGIVRGNKKQVNNK